MQLSRIQLVVGLMLVWAAALVGIDKTLNHAPKAIASESRQEGPQLLVTFTHFCCSGCYDKMFSAASKMSWIVSADKPVETLKNQGEMQMEKVAEGTKIDSEYQKNTVLQLSERDIRSVDLVRVSREFQDAGLVAKHMILKNIPHFRLTAVNVHLCCGLCTGAAQSAMKIEQASMRSKGKTLNRLMRESDINAKYMPTFDVNKKLETVSAEYYDEADVTNFSMALERAGFSPSEIRIETL